MNEYIILKNDEIFYIYQRKEKIENTLDDV